MDAYRKLTSRKKYAQNEFYHNFRDALWTATEEGAMPPVRDLIPPEQGDEDDLDDDIVAGGATQNFRCPITTNLFEDPITKYVFRCFGPLVIAHLPLSWLCTAQIASTRTQKQPFTSSSCTTTDVPHRAVTNRSVAPLSSLILPSPAKSPHSSAERRNVNSHADSKTQFSTKSLTNQNMRYKEMQFRKCV